MKSKKPTPPRSVFVPDPATDPARLDSEAALEQFATIAEDLK